MLFNHHFFVSCVVVKHQLSLAKVGNFSEMSISPRLHNKNSKGEGLTANVACTKSLCILEGINDLSTDNTFTDDRELLIGVECSYQNIPTGIVKYSNQL